MSFRRVSSSPGLCLLASIPALLAACTASTAVAPPTPAPVTEVVATPTPEPAPAPEPPPTEEEAAARLAWAPFVEQATSGAACEAVLPRPVRGLFARANPPLSEVARHEAAYLWLARCAEKQRFYQFSLDLAVRRAKAVPEDQHIELGARALIGFGEVREAADLLDKVLAKFPNDGNLLVTAAKARCRLREWAACRDLASRANNAATGPDGGEITARAIKYSARAELHLGDLDNAETSSLLLDLGGGDPEDLEAIKQQLTMGKTFSVIVEPEVTTHLALGTYHLAGRIPAVPAPVRVYVTNVGPDRQVKVDATLQGVSSTATKTVTIRQGKETLIELTPRFLPSFKPAALRATQTTDLVLKVTSIVGKEKTVVYDNSSTVDIEPRDFLPMTKVYDAETTEPRNDFMGAWVTPNARAVDALLAKAKARAPGRSFTSSSPSLPQVKALYDELKARGVSYVTDPEVNSGMGFGQRTRLPSEVLKSTNAQCLEGTLLFASLLEAIDQQPMLVLVPGHAFVGWFNISDKTDTSDAFFLETTAIGSSPFEDALAVAVKEYRYWKERDAVTIVSLKALRDAGVTPQPQAD